MLEMLIGGAPSKPPGADTLIGEYLRPDGGHTGYYGVVAETDFITPAALRTLTGVSGSVVTNTVSWLKFYIDGSILYVAQRPINYSIDWNTLNAFGVIFGKTITIKSKLYKVRSFKTLPPGITAANSLVSNNEWDRLMSNISTEALARQEGDKWASFTPGQLGLDTGVGSLTLCQEANNNTAGQKWVRGLNSVGGSGGVYPGQAATYTYMGWRPVLELMA